MAKYEMAAVFSDSHVPFHDKGLHKKVLKFLDDTQPQRVVLDGDIADLYEVSSFDKDPGRKRSLQDELDATHFYLREMREAVPDAQIQFIEGNHEYRLQRWLWKHPEIASLKSLNLPVLLDLRDLDISYHRGRGNESYIKVWDVVIGHWKQLNKWSGYTAKNLMDRMAANLIQGGTHRGGTHYRTYRDGKMYTAAENFCLCGLDAEYANNPDWQQGFNLIYHAPRTRRSYIQPVPVKDGRFLVGSEEY